MLERRARKAVEDPTLQRDKETLQQAASACWQHVSSVPSLGTLEEPFSRLLDAIRELNAQMHSRQSRVRSRPVLGIGAL
jgi:ABC-type uncharacterized transport system YnjBCD ATPase subunit